MNSKFFHSLYLVSVVAEKEFKDGVRNRWVIAITLMFSLLSIGLSYFGAAASGMVGFTSISTTVVSLASLAVFIIPLIALMLSFDAIVGEDESGTLLLLMTYPLSRLQLLLGKFLGHGAIMAVATILGFGSAALVIAFFSPLTAVSDVVEHFSLFIVSAILLGWVFVALAYCVSAWVSEKSKAAGIVLVIWMLFVVVFHLALLALLVGYEGRLDERVVSTIILFNPADAFRLLNLMGFDGRQVASGVLSVAGGAKVGIMGLMSILFAWVVVPFLISYRLFLKRVV
ncbi:MAG: ABC transporter permease [Pseudomonadales bacterium]|nr:ABC transporter permease [Pseudomonadales bacterium]